MPAVELPAIKLLEEGEGEGKEEEGDGAISLLLLDEDALLALPTGK